MRASSSWARELHAARGASRRQGRQAGVGHGPALPGTWWAWRRSAGRSVRASMCWMACPPLGRAPGARSILRPHPSPPPHHTHHHNAHVLAHTHTYTHAHICVVPPSPSQLHERKQRECGALPRDAAGGHVLRPTGRAAGPPPTLVPLFESNLISSICDEGKEPPALAGQLWADEPLMVLPHAVHRLPPCYGVPSMPGWLAAATWRGPGGHHPPPLYP